MKIILASASPRRRELLKMVVPTFETMASQVEEKIDDTLLPREQAVKLAYIKAKEVYDKTEGNRIVIGSDTIVTKNGKIFGKPKDKLEAEQILQELVSEDKAHEVITGLAVIVFKDGQYKEFKTADSTKIFLKDMTQQEIKKWIATGKALDKAGAYGIQDEFGVFVERIEGSYYTVVGLPVHKVYDILNNCSCIYYKSIFSKKN